MIIWIILFLIILAISFVLAYLSMKEFPEIPSKTKYGLYLIRNPELFTLEILELLKYSIASDELISLERLFRGSKSALVIFGPREKLKKLSSLNLLELEDYTSVESEEVVAWEVGFKGGALGNIFDSFPQLDPNEQFWFQVSLKPKKQDFQVNLRAALTSPTEERRASLSLLFQNLSNGELVKLPKPLTSNQIFSQFKERAITLLIKDPLILNTAQILNLVLPRSSN